jgi:hypothetical protein
MLDQMTAKEKNMSKLEGRILMAEPPMIAPAAQAVGASGSSKGAPLFVAADPDLVAKDLQDSLRRSAQTNPAVGVQRYGTALEFTYGFPFRGGALILQPDMQYIIRPGGTGQFSNAFLGGVRAGINF